MANIEHWAPRHRPLPGYQQLLDLAGVSPGSLREHAHPAGDDTPFTGVRLADCLAEPALLKAALRAHAGQGADSRALRIHASVLHQDLALNVIGPLTIRLLLEGESGVAGADGIWLDLASSTTKWRWVDPGQALDMEAFVTAMAEQVNAWYPLFRKELGVSPGAYWSSVGLGLCAPFSALYDKAPPQQLCREATQWLNRFDCDAKRFIDWIPAQFNHHPCAIPQRRGCCLKYLLPGGGYCGTCGLYRKERMAHHERMTIQ